MNATDYKIQLLTYILQNIKNIDLIAFEVPFLSNSRIADAVVLTDETTIAFEIKADNDRTDNIPNQISDYMKVFDYVYVVTNEKNLKKIENLKCGKMINKKPQIKVHTTAKKNRTRKEDIIKSIRLSLAPNQRTTSATDARKIFIEDLKRKYKDRYLSFISEKSKEINIEDIKILSRHGILR